MQIDDFTLLIPVRERHYNIPKIQYFYRDLKSEKIIIDSSEKIYENTSSLIKDGFRYYHFPEFHFFYKMKNAVNNLVETKYMLDCPDDDYFSLEIIKKCVNFLKYNKGFVLCDGLFLELEEKHLYKKYCGSGFDFYKKEDIVSRLYDVFGGGYYARNHSILKTEVSRKIYNFVCSNQNIQSINYFDRFFTFISCIEGRFKTFSDLYCIRKGGDDRLVKNEKIMQQWDKKVLKNHIKDDTFIELSKLLREKKKINDPIKFLKQLFQKNLEFSRGHSSGNIDIIYKQNKKEIDQVARIMWK